MTQDTGECPYRRLYIDISAWIADAKILSVFERTGHHGQYEGHKGPTVDANVRWVLLREVAQAV